MTTINIATLNVNGINDYNKCLSIFNTLKTLNCEIIALQETHIIQNNIDQIKSLWPYDSEWNPAPSSNSCGTAILLGPKTEKKGYTMDTTGRIITVKTQYNDNDMQITNIYAPNDNQHREHFFDQINNYMYNNTNHSIITGDFNMVEKPEIDRVPPSKSSTYTKGINNLNKLKQKYDLRDIWRDRNKKAREFTWNSQQANVKKSSRLDRFYISSKITLLNQKIIRIAQSDHAIVLSRIVIPTKAPRGPGYYKLNNNILKDPNYTEQMSNILNKIPYDPSNPNLWWDYVKTNTKYFTIEYCAQRKRKINNQIDELRKSLETERDIESINEINEEITTLSNDINGIIVRSRVQTVLNEDKPSKYFYLQEQIKQTKGVIKEIHTVDEQGKIIDIFETEEDVLKELNRHHEELYKNSDDEIDDEIQQQYIDEIDKFLTQEQKDKLDEDITIDEIKSAIKGSQRNKAPGPDGLTVEFYDTFQDVLGNNLVKLFNHIYTSETQPYTQKIGYIKLNFKKGIKYLLSNWRSITLLNVDNKLLTKIIARRMREVLPTIISVDQTCGIPDRQIFDNTYLIRDVIDHANARNIPTYIVSYDVKNAYDRVNHNYLYKVLKKFNFGDKFINYIRNIYTNRKVYVMNNGHMTRPITMGRGLSQGCSLSQYLHETQEEPYAISIRKDNEIKGYRIPGCPREIKITQYADDSNSVTTDVDSVQKTVDKIQHYEKASGRKLNKQKTKGLMIRTDVIPEVNIHIEWNPPGGIKELGVVFYNDNQEIQNMNWSQAVTNCQQTIDTLRYRENSLKGKVTILNTKVLSRIVHLASNIKMPDWAWCDKDRNGIKKIIFNYLWNNANPEPIQREIIFLPKEKGGLGLLNMVQQTKALRLKFITQITDINNTKTWVYMARYWLRSKLHRLRPEWEWMNQDMNNTIRYISSGIDVTPYNYKQLLKDYIDNKEQIITNKAKTTKEIYVALRKTEEDKTDVFVQHLWERSPILTITSINWKNVWLNMYRSYNVGPIRDILYKLVHNCLPTKVRIKKTKEKQLKGRKFNTKCSQCTKVDENILHIFARCKHACNVWNLYKPIYTKLLPNKPYIYEHNALTINLKSQAIKPKIKKLLLTITEIILQELWQTRNQCYKEGIQPSKETSKNRINKNITRMIRTHYKYHKYNNTINIFKDKFLINQALGDLDYHNELNLNLPP